MIKKLIAKIKEILFGKKPEVVEKKIITVKKKAATKAPVKASTVKKKASVKTPIKK